jgi:hypothetical protein
METVMTHQKKQIGFSRAGGKSRIRIAGVVAGGVGAYTPLATCLYEYTQPLPRMKRAVL